MHTLIAGTPLSGIGTVSQKSFPARREIFSSKVKDSRIVSICALILIRMYCQNSHNLPSNKQVWRKKNEGINVYQTSPRVPSSPYNMPSSSYRIPITLGTLAVMPDARNVGHWKWSLPHHAIGPKGQVLCSRRPFVRSTPRSAVSWHQLA